jgi:hypothetical protein
METFMPAVRAYASEEVIARGLALEASGFVTSRSLHQALGGRGDPTTASAVREAFAAHRDRLGVGAAREGGRACRRPPTRSSRSC